MNIHKRNSIFFRLVAVMVVMAFAILLLLSGFLYYIIQGNTDMVTAHRQLFGFFLFLLFLIVFLAHYNIKRLLGPIRMLKNGVDAIAQGNYDIDVPVRTKDELGDLTRAFNTMATEVRHTLKAKDQLLADVSHELKTPVTSLKLGLELVEDEDIKNSMREDLLELESMISELLEAEQLKYGKDALQLTRADVSSLIREVVQIYGHKKPGLVLKECPDKLELEFDVKRFRSVLRNVFDNALKYSTPNSQPVEIKAYTQASMFILEVNDDGLGIPPEELSSIFKPFYRVDRSRNKQTGGHGLGLHLCKKIMEAHGGTIDISNRERGGVCVRMELPM